MNDFQTFFRRYIQSAAGCVYFFAGGVLQRRHRPLLYTLSKHFGFEREKEDPNAKPEPTIPRIPAREIIADETTVQLTRIADVDGNISPAELMIIAALVKQRQPALCFEIGTFDGRTTENIAANQPDNGHCYTLDLPPDGVESAALPLASGDLAYIKKEQSGTRISAAAKERNITQLYGDSAVFDFTAYFGRVDLMFVDGSHSYNYVLADTEKAYQMVRPGGMILWHDYDRRWWPGVTRALNELQSQDDRFRAIRHIENTALCFMVRDPLGHE